MTEHLSSSILTKSKKVSYAGRNSRLIISTSMQRFEIGQTVEWDVGPRMPICDTRIGTILCYSQTSSRYLIHLRDIGAPRWVSAGALRSSAITA